MIRTPEVALLFFPCARTIHLGGKGVCVSKRHDPIRVDYLISAVHLKGCEKPLRLSSSHLPVGSHFLLWDNLISTEEAVIEESVLSLLLGEVRTED